MNLSPLLRLNWILLLILFPLFSMSQVTISSDRLNNSSTVFTVAGGAYYSGTSAAGDRPASVNQFSEGTHSYGMSNGTATLTSSAINTAGYTSISMTLRVASHSVASTGNGADGTDIVKVEISPDGGTTYYNTVQVVGNTNAYWGFGTGTGDANTPYDGETTPVSFTPASGGNRTTDGYSTITITSLPSVSDLRIKITALNNSANERWLIDDFILTGTASSPCTEPTAQPTSLVLTPTSTTAIDGSFTASGSANGYIVVRSTSSTLSADPSDGTTYSAGNSLGGGTVVYVGTSTTFTASSLSAGTRYYFFVYGYNSGGCSINYLTSSASLTNNAYTYCAQPTAQPTSLVLTSPSSTQIDGSFTVSGSANGYVVVVSTSSTLSSSSVDGTTYVAGDPLGGWNRG